MSGDDNKFNYGGTLSGGVNYGNNDERQGAAPIDDHSAFASPQMASQAAQQAPQSVKDITTAQFMSEVIEASSVQPVLVDFWAPWCGPCKQMEPALNSAIAKAAGRVVLVKMNIDEHPEVSEKMGIQSIPAVVAFVNGQPIDAMSGAKTESEISAFIDKVSGPKQPSQLEMALEQANQFIEAEEFEQAGQIYSAILQQMPDNLDAMAGLGNALLGMGDSEAAKGLIETIPDDHNHAGLNGLISKIALLEQANDLGEVSELKAKVDKNPKDHQARFDLAIALNAANQREEAAEQLLEIIATDRKWNDDGARTQLLQFFEAWGNLDEATLMARRKLSSLLFS